MIKMSLEKIKQVFENLPEIERNRAIIFVEGKVYTWNECMDIIKNDEDSDLAKTIIAKLEGIIG